MESIFTIQYAADCGEKKNKKGICMAFIDLEKLFDRIPN